MRELRRSLMHPMSLITHVPVQLYITCTPQLTTSWGRGVFAFLPKDGSLGDPCPTNSLEFLELAGSTFSTLLLTPPPPTEPRPFHTGEATNLTCIQKEQGELGCRIREEGCEYYPVQETTWDTSSHSPISRIVWPSEALQQIQLQSKATSIQWGTPLFGFTTFGCA